MTKYKIIDNFLSDSDFTELTNYVLPISIDSNVKPTSPFGWNYNGNILPIGYDEDDRFNKVTNIEIINPINSCPIFTNVVQIQSFHSQYIGFFGPLLDKINPIALFRIQANLTVQQKKRRRTPFHIDHKKGKLTMITSIFYVNTTNGPTILEDGTEIECRANRLVSYPHNTYHAGVLCTDQPYRIVINLNYFKDLDFS